MTAATALHRQIEDFLTERIPSALSPRAHVEPVRISCGNNAWDELLQGGLPAGVLTEFVGAPCSGRTTMALAYMAALTQAGSVGAWVDVADALDPEAAAANGVDLERLLWVRCGATQTAVPDTQGMEAVSPAITATPFEPRQTGSGSPHPRSEGRDMPQAIGALLQAHGGVYDRQVRREKRAIGTPGAPNRPLSQGSSDREEQIAFDRLPARRGEQIVLPCLAPRTTSMFVSGSSMRSAGSPWQALDQALRVTDLLLQAGGFSAIVLDLGSTPAEFAWRVPLATWFRYRAACERTRASLLLLTQHPCARSSAELVVRMETGGIEAEGKVMTGICYRAEVERQRFQQRESKVVPIRKPPQAERPGQWRGKAAWAQGQ